VKFDASTKVGTLYRAVPSAAPVLRRFRISVDADGEFTLREISQRRHFSLEELMRNLENLTWEEESASG
jgi:iron-sulfur cluster repair protein YtfE (RIC family)